MGALMTIPAKVSKMLPRLASDSDGEVVATVRAIHRTLEGVGLDWHDLVKAMDKDDTPSPRRSSKAEPSYSRPGPRLWADMDISEREQWLNLLIGDYGGGHLTKSQYDFVADICDRYPWRRPLSNRQEDFIDGLLVGAWKRRRS